MLLQRKNKEFWFEKNWIYFFT